MGTSGSNSEVLGIIPDIDSTNVSGMMQNHLSPFGLKFKVQSMALRATLRYQSSKLRARIFFLNFAF
jgi:hypothetical protein